MDQFKANFNDICTISERSPQVAQLSKIVGLSFIVLGFDGGFMTVSMSYIRDDFQDVNDTYKDIIMLTSTAAAGFGGLVTILLNYLVGTQKFVLVCSNVAFLIGHITHVFAPSPSVILWSRAMVGLATGISITTGPLMISEACTPKSIRGIVVGLLGLGFTFGIFLVNAFSWTLELSWRILPIVPIFLNIFQICLLHNIPPQDQIEELPAAGQGFSDFFFKFIDAFRNASVRSAVVAGILVHVVRRVAGADSVVRFGPDILKTARYETDSGFYTSTLSLFGTLSSLVLIDSVGRKPILLSSISFLFLTFISLFLEAKYSKPSLISVLLFYAFFFLNSLCFTTIPLVYNAEVYPIGFKILGGGFSMAANCFASVIVSVTLPSLQDRLELLIFGVHAMCCAIGFIGIAFLVPETMNTSVEERRG